MKSNIIKYVFAIIVIGLVAYSAYIIYGKKDNINNTTQEVQVSQNIEIIDNIRVPVVNFDTINPILSNNSHIQNIANLVYEPLLSVDENYKIELILAKEWSKINPTSYVIKLKDDIKWEDGNKLTAKDIKYTIDRLKDENVKSIYTYNVQEVTKVEVIDDNTIRINLNKEVPFFEYNLTFPIMSHKYFENEDFVNTSKNINPVGTGRYRIITEDGNIILRRNVNWWNKEENDVKLKEIHIIKYNNMGEVYKAFKLGNIDIIPTESLDIEDYIGTIGYNAKEYKGRELDYIAFNCENEELTNKEVRQAIFYAIDKQNIVSSIYKREILYFKFYVRLW